MIYFTADTHFGHKNIMNFCPKTRPYKSVEDMDADLVYRWNSLVSDDDIVYFLGDFKFSNVMYEKYLNGKKHLILGNHDRRNNVDGWESISSYKEIKLDGKLICLFHFPISAWNRQQYGALHLHGHTHGNNHDRPDVPCVPNRLDVGVDATGKIAISWEEVQEQIKKNA